MKQAEKKKMEEAKQQQEAAQKSKKEHETRTPSKPPNVRTTADRHITCLRNHLKRYVEVKKQNTKKIEELQLENKRQQVVIERLKKREARAKNSAVTASPASKVKKLMKSGTPKQIARRMLFAETMSHAVESGYKGLSSKQVKNQISSFIVNNASYFKKYRLMNGLKSVSSKIFHMNHQHRSNNSRFKMNMKKLKTQVEADVINFFEDDDYSRPCPGKRDFFVRKQVKRQKRFLSGTLKNLHEKFCEKMGYRLSYATFCKLKPFWVVHWKVTERDTRVCKVHENMELLVTFLYAAGILENKSCQ